MGNPGGFGTVLRNNFKGHDVPFIETSQPAETNPEAGTAVIIVSKETGDNSIVVSPGSNFFSVEDGYATEVTAAFKSSKMLLTQLETTPESVKLGVEVFRSEDEKDGNRWAILNPAPSPENWEGGGAEAFTGIINAGVDILTPNEEELQGCHQCLFPDGSKNSTVAADGESSRDLSQRLAADILNSFSSMTAVVVTLGGDGAIVCERGSSGSIQTSFVCEVESKWKSDPVIDTVGAGDCFNGGFASFLCSDVGEVEGLTKAAEYGCTAAGFSVRREGAQTSYPDAKEMI